MTAPAEHAMAHCRDCAHRLGSGCGCECCTWAGEAVRAAAEAIGHGHPSVLDEAIARDAVQAMLPVVWVAAVAAERERITLALFGCRRCGKVHQPIKQPWPRAADWRDPADGHPYQPLIIGGRQRQEIADLLRGGERQ